jgi:uncharacterized membrane protein YdjX (TVP38/TMEM64 family)
VQSNDDGLPVQVKKMSDVIMSEIECGETKGASSRHLKWILTIAILTVLVSAYIFLPVREWLVAFQDWAQSLGPLGWVIFILVYALTAFFLVPGSILSIGAGVAYGLWGFPLVMIGATLGSALSFLAARHIFHDRVQEKITHYPRFRAVNEAIRDEGWKVVVLLRLSPALPFSLQNWFLGVMPVGFWPSQIATFFGIMPGTLLYIWVSSLGGEAAMAGGDDIGDGGSGMLRYTILGLGLIATLVVTVIVTKKARQKLQEFSVE